MNRLGTVSTHAEEVDDEQEFEKFDEFVHTLSSDDFWLFGGFCGRDSDITPVQ